MGLLALRSPPMIAPSKLDASVSILISSAVKREGGLLVRKYTEPRRYFLKMLLTLNLIEMKTAGISVD